MMLMIGLFWAAIIIGIVVLIRWLATSRHYGRSNGVSDDTGPVSALDVPNQRYARGKISKQEFEDIRENIQVGV